MNPTHRHFRGLDFRQTSTSSLAGDLAARYGAEAGTVLDCRLKEATRHALLGQTSLALQQLGDLLRDEQRVFGDADSRVFELRRQIGLLQLGAGQRQTAEQTPDPADGRQSPPGRLRPSRSD